MVSNDENRFPGLDFNKLNLQKVLTDFKMPGIDVQALLAAQQKNIAALTEANKHAVEGLQLLAKRELDILQQAMNGAADAAREIASAGDPKEAAARQAQFAKAAFEQAVANMRALADIVGKSNDQAFDVIRKRVAEGMEELTQKWKSP